MRAWLVALWCAGALGCYVPVTPEPDPGRLADFPLQLVKQVLSGDTIVLDDGGDGTTLRYARVTAPPAGSTHWGDAKELNARLVEGQEVRVMPVEHDGEDLYGFVFVPNASRRIALFVQLELARAGYVRAADVPDDRDDLYFERIMKSVEAARRERLGIWASGASGR